MPNPKLNTTDDGYLKPDNNMNIIDNMAVYRPLDIDTQNHMTSPHKRRSSSSISECSEDSQTSPYEGKKIRLSVSSDTPADDVLDSLKSAVLCSGASVLEKQQQISLYIAELQKLQKTMTASNGETTEPRRCSQVCMGVII